MEKQTQKKWRTATSKDVTKRHGRPAARRRWRTKKEKNVRKEKEEKINKSNVITLDKLNRVCSCYFFYRSGCCCSWKISLLTRAGVRSWNRERESRYADRASLTSAELDGAARSGRRREDGEGGGRHKDRFPRRYSEAHVNLVHNYFWYTSKWVSIINSHFVFRSRQNLWRER